ncbi:LysR substrate-binding domain-containing protein [Kitasatospora sp. NPDC093679]|uniref:LysR substrate-binding domain-containing protein n=1 Tax=Kitasatospora sp. NPDC093679 TaxID=3154983 RepID=UPI0034129A12
MVGRRRGGGPLLDAAVTPTEVGRTVLPYARAALAAADAVRNAVDEHAGLLRGRVTLGLVPGATDHAFDVASFLADFHDAHPALEMALTEGTSDRMQAALLAGEIDIALLGPIGDEPPPGLAHRTVVDAPIGAALSPGDPLLAAADRTELPLADLQGRQLICLPRGTGVREALERACTQAGFRPRIAFEAAAPHVLARLAARGLGVAVLPLDQEGPGRTESLRTLPIVRPRIRARIVLAWPADPQVPRPEPSSDACTTPCQRHPRCRAGNRPGPPPSARRSTGHRAPVPNGRRRCRCGGVRPARCRHRNGLTAEGRVASGCLSCRARIPGPTEPNSETAAARKAMSAPSRAKARATARPMPESPPVINATRPARRPVPL